MTDRPSRSRDRRTTRRDRGATSVGQTPVQQGVRISWLFVLTLGVIVLGTLTLSPTISLLVEQRQEIAALEAQIASQEENVDDLGREISRWDDPAYIEAQARDRLFYVYPGELSFVVLDDRTEFDESAPLDAFSSEVETTKIDWTSALVETIVVAGLTEDLPDDFPEGTP
ncbi:FtsB family cell division protein [Humidisolicoccus flavus]|uniref:FtsB family cell division protein n=1 Tax=Humidisolicoccus flavus TaxID=3111414 RepID=UPI003251E581